MFKCYSEGDMKRAPEVAVLLVLLALRSLGAAMREISVVQCDSASQLPIPAAQVGGEEGEAYLVV